jgi:hypothetical protein
VAAMIKINIDVFEYGDADWDRIERVVENAGLITRSIGGRVRTSELSLREHVTMVAIKHIALTTIFTSPTQRARTRQLEALEHSATRFYEKLVAALSTDFSFSGAALGMSDADCTLALMTISLTTPTVFFSTD